MLSLPITLKKIGKKVCSLNLWRIFAFLQASVSIKRLGEFLQNADLDPTAVTKYPDTGEG